MKQYQITTSTIEENEKVLAQLSYYIDRGDIAAADLDINKRIGLDGKRFTFKCEKSIWKKLKKELNLNVYAVFSRIEEEA